VATVLFALAVATASAVLSVLSVPSALFVATASAVATVCRSFASSWS
jgi:hypothetical protein